jgi:hypothetical protein
MSLHVGKLRGLAVLLFLLNPACRCGAGSAACIGTRGDSAVAAGPLQQRARGGTGRRRRQREGAVSGIMRAWRSTDR